MEEYNFKVGELNNRGTDVFNLDELKIQPKNLFDYLYEQLESSDENLLKIIEFFKENDIVELSIEAFNEKCNIFHIEFVLDKVGIVKEFEISIFLSLIKIMHDNNPEYYPWFTNTLFTRIANNFPDIALELINELKSLKYKFISEALSILINENPNLDVNKKYDFSIEYISSNIEPLYIAGYIILEKCVKNPLFSKKSEAIDLLHQLMKTKTDNELLQVVHTVCNLSLTEYSFQNDIISIKKNDNPQINYVISQFLFHNSKKIIHSDFLKKLFFSFASIPCEFKGIIDNLDFVLMHLVKIDFNFFYEFISKWILESDYQQKNISFCDIWKSFFSNLSFDTQVIYIYTSFLLKNEIAFNRVASEIIYNKGLLSKKTFSLDKTILENCNDEDIIFLCRKILGYIFDINIICDFFDSILQIKINNKMLVNEILNLFISLGNDYGYVVVKYFESKDFTTECELNIVYKDILFRLNNILEQNKRVNDYLELNGTYEEILEINRYQFEEQKKMFKQAEEKSVITKLCKKTPLKYGIGFSYNFEGKNSDISFFKEYSVAINISKQDIYSPVNSQLIRTQYKLCKRGDK